MLPLLLAGQTVVASAEPAVYHGRRGETQVAIPRLEDEMRVDGVLDEARLAAGRAADRLLAVRAGRRRGRPTNATEVLVFYSPTAIHFGVRAQAAPGTVRATLANRDRLDTEDQVRIFLVTFNDGRQALYFAVNPLGVQADGALVEGTRHARRRLRGARDRTRGARPERPTSSSTRRAA